MRGNQAAPKGERNGRAAVAAADLNFGGAAEVARSIGGLWSAIHIDITLSDSVNAAVDEVPSRTARIDILVNNAGIAGRTAPVWEVTDEDWQQVIAVNMTGAFLPAAAAPCCCICARAAMAHRQYRVDYRQGSRYRGYLRQRRGPPP